MPGPNAPTAAERPKEYAALLRHPISSDAKHPSYEGWEFDHGSRKRFFIGGMLWFMRTSGIDRPALLAAYGERAAETAEDETEWTRMPNSGELWSNCSEVQFRNARGLKPMFFQKAALVLLSCELALAERIRTGRAAKDATPLDVYSNMSIIPACWHVDEFDKPMLKRITENHRDALTGMRDAAKQSAKTFLDHLAAGHTVTYPIAAAVKSYLEANCPQLQLGAVSARPSRTLGSLHATEFQDIRDAG